MRSLDEYQKSELEGVWKVKKMANNTSSVDFYLKFFEMQASVLQPRNS